MQLKARPPLRLNAALRSGGFTLIEVLITVFVTAIGLLTVAGLQAAAKKANFESAQRTTAVALAQDMVERMRSNDPATWSSYYTSDSTAAASSSACTADTGCAPGDRAAFDLYQWNQRLVGAEVTDSSGNATGGLVSPTGCVRLQSTGVYRVAIAWRGMSPITPLATDEKLYDACGTGLSRYTDPKGVAEGMRRVIFVEFM
jgi:type IV pilus assembly protein PilV